MQVPYSSTDFPVQKCTGTEILIHTHTCLCPLQVLHVLKHYRASSDEAARWAENLEKKSSKSKRTGEAPWWKPSDNSCNHKSAGICFISRKESFSGGSVFSKWGLYDGSCLCRREFECAWRWETLLWYLDVGWVVVSAHEATEGESNLSSSPPSKSSHFPPPPLAYSNFGTIGGNHSHPIEHTDGCRLTFWAPWWSHTQGKRKHREWSLIFFSNTSVRFK